MRRPRVQAAVALFVGSCLVAPVAMDSSHGDERAERSGAFTEDAAYSARPRPVAPVEEDPRGPTTDRTATVVTDSAWSWFMDPRVLTTSRATYFSSVRDTGDIQVTSVDHGSARLRHAVLQPDFEPDDHNAPSLSELEDGRIVAFWNAHGLVPAHYRITMRSGDVTTFGPALELTGSGLEDEGTTYTSIIRLRGAEEQYHLFTRRSSDDAWVMTTSDDLVTWSPAVRLFAHVDDTSYPYVKFVGTGWRTIHMAFSDTTARSEEHSSLHHVALSDGVFRRSDGTAIRTLDEVAGSGGEPPRPIEPGRATRIHDGRGADGRARPYDIALDDGDPVVAFTTGNRWTDEWTYRWMRRTDGVWTGSTLDRSTTDPGGISLRHDDPTRAVLVREGRVEEYRTDDDGRSWTRRALSSTDDNRTPATPWSSGRARGPVSAAWLSGPYEGFRHGAWETSLTMSTSGRAPLDLRAAWSRAWAKGGPVTVTTTAGVDGPPVADRTVWLLVTRPGGEEEWLRYGRTDDRGRVRLSVGGSLPRGSRARLVVPATSAWGQAVSPARTSS